MRLRNGLVVVLVVGAVLVVSMNGAALGGTDIEDPTQEAILSDDTAYELINATYNRLPEGVTSTISTMGEGPCGIGLNVLQNQGLAEVPAERDVYDYEQDPLEGDCKDFRDALQHRTYEGDDPPYLEQCRSFYGKNCVAVGHYACDFALVVGSGLVYFCLGGLTPYN